MNIRKSFPQLRDEQWLREQIKDKPMRSIAAEIGSSYGAIACAVRKFGISVPQRIKHRVSLDHSAACKQRHLNKWPDGRFGAQASNWKGGRIARKNGYVFLYMPNHPMSNRQGYIMEHRVVMEGVLGRQLETTEMVHHLNGDRHDNRPENLQVVASKKEHFAAHFDAVKAVKGLVDENAALRAELAKLKGEKA